MRRTTVLPALAVALALHPAGLRAQDVNALLAAGDSAYDAYRPVEAVRAFEAVLALDSTRYDANWKAARSMVDIAKQIAGSADSLKRRRDSLYAVARSYAERALRIDSTDAEGHFARALVLGQLSRTRGGKERVRFAKIIFDESSRAVALDSTHDGAHHILGAWHAEVKRLSGIQKFFAKTLFGGGFLDRGSWDEAIAHLQRAVALRPDHVFHRLELAEVLVDRKRYSEARELLASIPPLPQSDVMDAQYQRDAARLAERIRDKRDGS
jgi:tetratricopeptide (TPR) repeat protein